MEMWGLSGSSGMLGKNALLSCWTAYVVLHAVWRCLLISSSRLCILCGCLGHGNSIAVAHFAAAAPPAAEPVAGTGGLRLHLFMNVDVIAPPLVQPSRASTPGLCLIKHMIMLFSGGRGTRAEWCMPAFCHLSYGVLPHALVPLLFFASSLPIASNATLPDADLTILTAFSRPPYRKG